MLLMKIAIFEITLGTIFTFVMGIAISMAIIIIIYLIYVLRGIRSKGFEELANVKIDEYEIPADLKKKEKKILEQKNRHKNNSYYSYEMIIRYQEIFKDKKLRNGMGDIQATNLLVRSLVHNIAALYYPDSKRPTLEISIDEFLTLSKYLSKRLSAILEYNGLKFFRRIKLNTIISVNDFSHIINDSAVVELTRKIHLNKILFGLKILLNIVNPIYWVRKAVVNTSFRIVSKKLCLSIIQIVGEETYNIYSKSVFNKEEGIDLIEG